MRKARDRGASDARGRSRVLAVMFAVGFGVLGVRASMIALSGGATDRALLTAPVAQTQAAGLRGDLVDRNGEILASTLTAHSLAADPRAVWNAEETARALISVLPDLDYDELVAKLTSKKRFVWLRRGMSPRARQAVFDLGLPGLEFREEPSRVYPRGRLAAHVLGFTDVDGRGVAGAERAFDAELSAGDGRPVALSIDLRAQYALDDEMRAAVTLFEPKAAVGVVTDVATGEIVAMVSLPDFEPNAPGAASASARTNRALASVYELGSVLKTVTFAAGLDTGAVEVGDMLDAHQPLVAGEAILRDPHPSPGPVSVHDAFVRSSNVGAALVARASGAASQRAYLARFGLLDRAPVGFAESAAPLLPADWNETAQATVAYGHGLAVSPVAFSAAFAATVNGGYYRRPTLEPVSVRDAPSERILSSQTSAQMRDLLRAVVVDGTGRRADVPGYRVGGKTGTGEKAVGGAYVKDRLVSSFAAVFPADAPRYSVLIVLDEPAGTPETRGRAGAGYTAAPVAGRVISRLAPVLGVPSDAALVAAYRKSTP